MSGEFFATLGVPSVVGRTFTSADDARGGGPEGPVAIISYGLWQQRFRGAATVIGTPLVVERIPFTIVGVMPPEFFGVEVGRAFDVALPFGAEPLIRGAGTWLDSRRSYWLTVMLRLKPEQSVDAATAMLRSMQPQIREAARPEGGPPPDQEEFLSQPFTLVPAAGGTSRLRQQYERPLLAVLIIVAVVLLIACANLANLLLARATARRHEMSVRLALGAARSRLARQLLIETLVLAAVGALAGLLLAEWGSRALVAQLSSSFGRIVLDLSLDWRVAAFTAAVTVGTALVFGTVPAVRATRVEPIDALKAQGRGASGGDARVALSSTLVIAQIALSLVLVIAAGLFVRTFERLARMPLGFDSDRVLVVTVDATRAAIAPGSRIPFYHRLVDAVAAVPGVAHAAASRVTPVSGSRNNAKADVPGAPPMTELKRIVPMHEITPRWLATYGTAIRAGRGIDERDTKTAPPVVLVNEAFARRFFPGRAAVGGSVDISGPRDEPLRRTVIGVVSDAVYRSLREDVPPTMYVPLAQSRSTPPNMSISIRSSAGSPVLLARSVAAALTQVDRSLAFSFRPLEDQVNASLTQERLVAMLSGFFGVLALLLAGIGLYGVTSYGVSRRRTEIGIRMALGAQSADVMRLVLARSIGTTAIGIALGLAAAAAVTRSLEAMLFGVRPLDPTTFVAVASIFGAVATLAAFLPARRATKVDPAVTLRSE